MTAQWAIDDNGDLRYGDRQPADNLVRNSNYLSLEAFAALVADVRAARLVDDMAAVIRRLDGGWHVLYRHDGDLAWQKGSHIQEPMSQGEVAALHHARRQGVQPDAYSTEGRRAAQDRHVDDFIRRAENARQQDAR